MQSVPITTKVVSSNPAHGEVNCLTLIASSTCRHEWDSNSQL